MRQSGYGSRPSRSQVSRLLLPGANAQWTKPQLLAQIRFVEFTAEGRLRHAAFLGLRTDKKAREVSRES
jgi:ATP-dependent DNA ligase